MHNRAQNNQNILKSLDKKKINSKFLRLCKIVFDYFRIFIIDKTNNQYVHVYISFIN